jgi:Nucleotidyl transferase AbiEii toxin, Type IV TA system
MPVSDLQREVATIALKAAAEHGFVLGGGNALILHGIVDRYTADVDLVTDRTEGVRAAAGAVQDALRAAGFEAERQNRDPVPMGVGPVLNPLDAIASKVRAFVTRAEERDVVDVAAALETYTVTELIALARQLEPGLEDEDFADAGRRLDRLSDKVFARYGLGPEDLAQLRKRFASWPRS